MPGCGENSRNKITGGLTENEREMLYFHWMGCSVKADLVLMEGVRDVIGHVACRMGQNDDNVGAGRGGGPQPVCLGLDE